MPPSNSAEAVVLGTILQKENSVAEARPQTPLTIRMHERDNVAIVANDGGLKAGTKFPSGLVLSEHVPQGHKVALVDLPEGAPRHRDHEARGGDGPPDRSTVGPVVDRRQASVPERQTQQRRGRGEGDRPC